MKLQLYSDLHLEFDPTFRPVNHGSDVLVLAGDICVGNVFTKSEDSPHFKNKQNFLDFFKHCSENWNDVIYVFGNHEYYHGSYNKTPGIIKEALSEFTNIHILDNQTIELNGFLFIGTTLWTDLNNNDPNVEMIVKFAMNDFKLIQYFDGHNYMKLQPFHTIQKHYKAKQFIIDNASLSDKVVVVGHHAPSSQSIHPNYQNPDDYVMNFAYHSNLERLIESMPQIKLWCHGHVHDNFEYQVGETLVACNPKGYHNQNKYFKPDLVIEL